MVKVKPWHRRHAVQIAAQLPENIDDALAVLCAAVDLVHTFLDQEDDSEPEVHVASPRPSLRVVPINQEGS